MKNPTFFPSLSHAVSYRTLNRDAIHFSIFSTNRQTNKNLRLDCVDKPGGPALKLPSLARSVPKPLKVRSLARSVPKPLKVPSLARSVPKLLLIDCEG